MKALRCLAGILLVGLLSLAASADTFAQEKGKGKGDGQRNRKLKRRKPPSWALAHGYRRRHVYFPEHDLYVDHKKGVYIVQRQ
jgi:hypothetical protein